MIHIFFLCVLLTCGRDGTRIHYGKKASRWRLCDALDNVLPEKPWLLPFMWMLLYNFTTFLNITADQGHPFMAAVFPNKSSFSMIIYHDTLQIFFRNGLMMVTYTMDLNFIRHICGMCWTNNPDS